MNVYFNDPNTSELCQPIRIIDAVLSWEPPSQPNWAINVIKRTERSKQCFKGLKQCRSLVTPCNKLPKYEVPRTLYCHDMAGGYLNDKDVKGNERNDGFEFFRWSCIDIFVYFSHHLVTIPPLGWINAAHKNGVMVLGTIITEGARGEAIWSKLLSDKQLISKFANSLARICQYYGFEGYLLNVENTIPPSKMKLFCDFISILRVHLKSNNFENMVIWYDSVIYPVGSIYYQNALNHLNRKFFDLTDGIFLNYAWSDKHLEVTLNNAGSRKKDVFVGVDVFGRGCRGGGGFGTVEAVEAVRKWGLSVALFAPGWVHECCLPGEHFLSRDYKFWDYLCDHLYVQGPSFLPFKTTFCLGRGKKFFVNGKLEKEEPWYDLNKQDYQISGLIGSHGTVDSCLSYNDEDGFNGGGSLLVKNFETGPENLQHVDRLFVCDFPTKKGDKLIFSITTKPMLLNTHPKLFIIVAMEENNTDSEYDLETPSGRVYEIGCMLGGDKSPLLIGELNIVKDGRKSAK